MTLSARIGEVMFPHKDPFRTILAKLFVEK